ncbi:MAG: tail fiber domain-containing protein, partial [Anaerovoracaceae bacterium]
QLDYAVPNGNSHVFYVNALEQMRINNNGNVGIGTTTPAQKLDVNGTAKANNLILTNVVAGSTTDKILVLGNDNLVRTINAVTGKNIYDMDGALNGNRTMDMKGFNLYFIGGNDFANTGRVGIGTASPQERLHVQGTLQTQLLKLTNAPNTGTASDKVLVLGTDNLVKTMTTIPSINIYNSNGDLTANRNVNMVSYNLSFTGGSDFTGTGRIGIGTTTPSEKLDVQGTTATQLLKLTNTLNTGIATDKILVLGADKLVRTIDPSTSNNIYTANGTLTSDRTVTQNGKTLLFTGGNVNLSSAISSDIRFVDNRDVLIEPLTRTNNGERGADLTIRAGSPRGAGTNNGGSRGGHLVLESGIGGDCSELQQNRYAGDIILRARANYCGSTSAVYGRILLAPETRFAGSVEKPTAVVAIGNTNPTQGGFFFLQVGPQAVCNGDSWQSTSDRRLKNDILPLSYGLKEVLQLQPKFFKYKSSPNVRQVGLIAQEVKPIIPELVSGEEGDLEKGNILSFNYANLTVVLVNAIQEQQKEIDILKAKAQEVDQLRAELNQIKAMIAELKK